MNDLLDVSRLESGRLVVEPEQMRLDDLVGKVVDELRPLIDDKALQLTVSRGALEPMIFADGQLMRQAVTNLLSNAIKYTPAGGQIDVTFTVREGRVACAIRDSGIGVPEEAQARLFEKFYRADNAVVLESEGTGLGLSLVRLVVEHFGGRVWCESARGEGALFTIELPNHQHTRPGLTSGSETSSLAPETRPATAGADHKSGIASSDSCLRSSLSA